MFAIKSISILVLLIIDWFFLSRYDHLGNTWDMEVLMAVVSHPRRWEPERAAVIRGPDLLASWRNLLHGIRWCFPLEPQSTTRESMQSVAWREINHRIWARNLRGCALVLRCATKPIMRCMADCHPMFDAPASFNTEQATSKDEQLFLWACRRLGRSWPSLYALRGTNFSTTTIVQRFVFEYLCYYCSTKFIL
jgi:hypothetical protein